MKVVPDAGHAVFYLVYRCRLKVADHQEYRVHTYRDGRWNVYFNRGGWWKENNGVCEEAEPLLKATLRKAQALLILKG